MARAHFVPLSTYEELPPDKMRREAEAFLAKMRRRRTVREFSDRPVPKDVIENCILAAGTAPNGANRQPWSFVMVGDPKLKSRIREAAEEEERRFYREKAPKESLTSGESAERNATSLVFAAKKMPLVLGRKTASPR